eukprot:scaffold72177_cov60-Phaeocystis_antarctica.AAC.3
MPTDPFSPFSPMASLVGSCAGIRDSRAGRSLACRRHRTHVPMVHRSRAKTNARRTPATALANTVKVSCPAPVASRSLPGLAAAAVLAASDDLVWGGRGDGGGVGGGGGGCGAGGCDGGEGSDGGAGGGAGGSGGGGDDGCQQWMMFSSLRQPAPGCHMHGE